MSRLLVATALSALIVCASPIQLCAQLTRLPFPITEWQRPAGSAIAVYKDALYLVGASGRAWRYDGSRLSLPLGEEKTEFVPGVLKVLGDDLYLLGGRIWKTDGTTLERLDRFTDRFFKSRDVHRLGDSLYVLANGRVGRGRLLSIGPGVIELPGPRTTLYQRSFVIRDALVLAPEWNSANPVRPSALRNGVHRGLTSEELGLPNPDFYAVGASQDHLYLSSINERGKWSIYRSDLDTVEEVLEWGDRWDTRIEMFESGDSLYLLVGEGYWNELFLWTQDDGLQPVLDPVSGVRNKWRRVPFTGGFWGLSEGWMRTPTTTTYRVTPEGIRKDVDANALTNVREADLTEQRFDTPFGVCADNIAAFAAEIPQRVTYCSKDGVARKMPFNLPLGGFERRTGVWNERLYYTNQLGLISASLTEPYDFRLEVPAVAPEWDLLGQVGDRILIGAGNEAAIGKVLWETDGVTAKVAGAEGSQPKLLFPYRDGVVIETTSPVETPIYSFHDGTSVSSAAHLLGKFSAIEKGSAYLDGSLFFVGASDSLLGVWRLDGERLIRLTSTVASGEIVVWDSLAYFTHAKSGAFRVYDGRTLANVSGSEPTSGFSPYEGFDGSAKPVGRVLLATGAERGPGVRTDDFKPWRLEGRTASKADMPRVSLDDAVYGSDRWLYYYQPSEKTLRKTMGGMNFDVTSALIPDGHTPVAVTKFYGSLYSIGVSNRDGRREYKLFRRQDRDVIEIPVPAEGRLRFGLNDGQRQLLSIAGATYELLTTDSLWLVTDDTDFEPMALTGGHVVGRHKTRHGVFSAPLFGEPGPNSGNQLADSVSVQVFPNPTSDVANVLFRLEEDGHFEVDVRDLLGRRVAVLHKGVLEAGEHGFQLEVEDFASGVYFVRASGSGRSMVASVVVAG